MGSFLLFEIRNVLRLEGYEVTKHTNRRVINTLLGLKKDSTLSNICEKLEISYVGREGDFEYNDSKEIFLHFLESKTVLHFSSMREVSREIGINLRSFSESKISKVIEKLIFVNGKSAVLSFNKSIGERKDFPRCIENKISINLALSTKLGYTVDYDISIPEIFDLLQEKIPNHRLKERLCQLLVIPYFFEREGFHKERIKVLAKAQDELLEFESLSSAGKFFQIDSKSISRVIQKNYRIPFRFKRYSLEFV